MKNLTLTLLLFLSSILSFAQVRQRNAELLSFNEIRRFAPLEYVEFQMGLVINPTNGVLIQPTYQKSVGIYRRFCLTNRFSISYPTTNNVGEGSIQTGIGFDITENLQFHAYPFWFKREFRDYGPESPGYTTPISICANYELPKQNNTSFELWVNYEDHSFYPTIRLCHKLLRVHNRRTFKYVK